MAAILALGLLVGTEPDSVVAPLQVLECGLEPLLSVKVSLYTFNSPEVYIMHDILQP